MITIKAMLVEIRHVRSEHLINRVDLDDPPEPGRWLILDEESFLVMQRRHRYALRNGCYVKTTVTLLVKPQKRPVDASPWRHGWVIGDPTCRFNALSPLLRCAVWPEGPCDTCSHREVR